MKKYRLLLLMSSLLIGACSSGDGQTTTEKSNNDSILKAQMKALEKAKGVEQILQRGADQRREAMTEQIKN